MTAPGAYGSALLTKLDKIDCSDVLAAVLVSDKQLLGHIKMGTPAKNIEFNWLEDELIGSGVNALGVASTSISVIGLSTSASLERIVRTNSILQLDGGECWFKVTGTTGASGIQGAVYASTIWVTTTTTGVWRVIATPYDDTVDASDDVSQERAKLRNFTQVFERAIQITQTRKGVDMQAVMDELQLQIKYRTMEIKRELDLSVISGKAYYDGAYVTGDYAFRTMNGIISMIRDPDVDNTNEDTMVTQISGALTVAGINDLLYKIWDAGGLDEMSDPIIVVGAKQQRIIAAMEKDIRRVEQGERQVGYYRDIFLSDMGTELPIVMDRWFPQDKLVILDRARISLKPLQGDAWHLEKMAKTGRSEKWQLSGQYGLQLVNPDKCHGLLYDLT
jgi:hypothetical protein